MTRSSVGAVIVTFNSGELVNRACAALLESRRRPDAIVVVDNASTDPASTAALQRLPPVVRVVRCPENRGFCGGNNLGIQEVGTVDHLLLLNPDAFVTPGFLEAAIDQLDDEPSLGALGPKLMAVDPESLAPNGRIDSVGIVQRWFGQFVDCGQGDIDKGQLDERPPNLVALCAAAMVCRRAALDSVRIDAGPFDERFFMYKEDIDLSLRLRNAGWRITVRPDLVVHHCRGTAAATRSSAPREIRRRSLRNEWRIWGGRALPLTRRIAMLPYLVAKSVLVSLGG